MSDFESQIRALRDRTESNRRQFLQTELQTCFIALDRARLELSLGDSSEAEKEFEIASHGKRVIEKFLGEAADEMPRVEEKLTELKASLSSFRSDLDAYRR